MNSAYCLTTPSTGAISGGANHTLTLRNDGTVWAFGDNTYGQLGDGSTNARIYPVQVSGLTGIVQIKAGIAHNVALKNDGTVWTWGRNFNGQIGDGTTTNRTSPIQVSGLTNIIAVAAGNATYALKDDGTVWAWGSNSSGQLGDGSTTQRTTPVQTSGLTSVSSIAASASHAVALKNDGTVWSYGNNYYGQLGDGTTTNRNVPVQVSGLTGITAIAAGASQTITLKSDGTVRTCGRNDLGQLGDNTTTNRSTPVQVSNLTNVVAVGSGPGSSHMLALRSDGIAWAWGNNANAQLGDGTIINRLSPVQVVNLSGIVALAAGNTTAIALKNDGTVKIWGGNSYGQFGDGTTNAFRPSPVQVAGLLGISMAAAGSDHNLAVRSDGTVLAWGWNNYSQLGDGTTTDRLIPVQVNGLTGVVSVAGGNGHSIALKSNGTLSVWGSNNVGQLGDGTTTTRSTPVSLPNFTDVSKVVAGNGSTIALKNNGTLWAWGWNGSGQLGDGTTTNRASPVQVSGLSGVIDVAAGAYAHTVALKSDGTVWAWGQNYYGAVGDGTTTNRASPVQVSGMTSVIAVAVGNSHSLALKSNGNVWAWGYNANGELGDGTTTDRLTPVQVSGLSDVVAISGGSGFAVAIKADGTVWTWGSNIVGQLGDGTTTQSTTPVQVVGLTDAVAVSAGGAHTIVLKGDSTLRGWGRNNYYQLGLGVLRKSQAAVRLAYLSDDTDHDGLTDAWETQYFGNITHSGIQDYDGDGMTNIQELAAGSSPLLNDVDGDLLTDIADNYPNDYYNGITPSLTIVSGDNQYGYVGVFNSSPFLVGVWNSSGTEPLVNAPVTFTVLSGGGKLATTNVGSPTLLTTLNRVTDIDGAAEAFYKHSATADILSQISVTAGNAQLIMQSSSVDVDTDIDGMVDGWEITHGLDPNVNDADLNPDNDSQNNLQEYNAGTNPVDYYNGRAFVLDAPVTGDGVFAYRYDDSGRLVAVTYTGNLRQQLTPDPAANLLAATYGNVPIVAWRTAHSLPADGSGDGADTANPAGDGLPNLAKYAFGLDPSETVTMANPIVRLTTVSGDRYLTLTYQRPNPAPTDAQYTVEVSGDDGATWQSGSEEVVEVSTLNDTYQSLVTVRDATAVGSPTLGRRIRLSLKRTL